MFFESYKEQYMDMLKKYPSGDFSHRMYDNLIHCYFLDRLSEDDRNDISDYCFAKIEKIKARKNFSVFKHTQPIGCFSKIIFLMLGISLPHTIFCEDATYFVMPIKKSA